MLILLSLLSLLFPLSSHFHFHISISVPGRHTSGLFPFLLTLFFSFTLNCFYRHFLFYFYMYCCTLNGYMVLIFLAACCCASFTLFIVTFTFTFTFLLVPFTFQLTLTFKYISERLPGGHIPRCPLLCLFHLRFELCVLSHHLRAVK